MEIPIKIKKWKEIIIARWNRQFLFLNDFPEAKKYFWFSLSVLPFLFFLITIIYPFIYHTTLPVAGQGVPEQAEFVSELIPLANRNKKELTEISDKLVALKFSEIYFQTQLQMAKNDSIGLTINLQDSTISLMIKGVRVREYEIDRFDASRLLKNIRTDLLAFTWLAEPFTLQQEWATLAKYPIKIRKAPRDTIEAKQIKTAPFELETPTVYFTLQFNRNLVVKIHQSESPSVWGRMKRWYYNRTLNFFQVKTTFLSIFHRQTPPSPIWLDLWIAKNDGGAIYRALPKQANLVLRF